MVVGVDSEQADPLTSATALIWKEIILSTTLELCSRLHYREAFVRLAKGFNVTRKKRRTTNGFSQKILVNQSLYLLPLKFVAKKRPIKPEMNPTQQPIFTQFYYYKCYKLTMLKI